MLCFFRCFFDAKIVKKLIQKTNSMKKIENNPTIKRKLLKFIELKNLTKNEFYLRCGLSNGFLDKDRGFTTDNLVKILTSYPEIDVNWLLLGSDDNPILSADGNSIIQQSNVGDNNNNSGNITNIDKRLIKMLEDSQKERLKLLTIIENLTSKN